jgi:hypothetical protein
MVNIAFKSGAINEEEDEEEEERKRERRYIYSRLACVLDI